MGEALAADGRARAPGRRVEQGCRDDGPLRGRGRRRARRDAAPAASAATSSTRSSRTTRTCSGTSPSTAATRWPAPCEVLGVRHEWLGFVDSGLPEGDPLPPLPEGCFAREPLAVAAAPLVRLVRAFRPHVMTTYDENGGYPHPDHIMCHTVSVEAFEAAGDADALPGHRRAVAAVEALLRPRVLPGEDRRVPRRDARRGPRVAVRRVARALGGPRGRSRSRPGSTAPTSSRYGTPRCSPTRRRSTRTGWFFTIPGELQRRVWPTEDFELARSHVPTELPEDDLFAGVRERVEAA